MSLIKTAIFFDHHQLSCSDEYVKAPSRALISFDQSKLDKARELLSTNTFAKGIVLHTLDTKYDSGFETTLTDEEIVVSEHGNLFRCCGKYCGTGFDGYFNDGLIVDSQLVDDEVVLPEVLIFVNYQNNLLIYLDDVDCNVSENVQKVIVANDDADKGHGLLKLLGELASLSNKKGILFSSKDDATSFEFEGKVYECKNSSSQENVLKFDCLQ